MRDLLQFDESIPSNFLNDRNPTIKFLLALSFLSSIFVESDINGLLMLFLLVFILGSISQGVKNIVQIYWGLKLYIFAVFAVSFMFNDFIVDGFILIIIIKLLSIFIAFSFFSKTTTPEQLIDVLIQLKIPSSIAWSIGVAFRQSILTLDDVYYIQQIQRLRNGYVDMEIPQKLVFRINEIYNMLVTILSRSVIISTEFALAIKMRGWQKPHKEIILNNSPIKLIDYVFLVALVGISFAILIIV